MAAPEPPLIAYQEPQPWGGTRSRDVRLHAWIRRADGTWRARVSYDDVNGRVEWNCDPGELVEKQGVDYGRVPVERVVPRVTGRVATGHEWRRTG